MKKSGRKSPKPSGKTNRKAKAASPAPEQPERRDMMKLMRNGAIGALAVGGLGWWGVSAVQATAAEHDLTRIGQGTPTIVQVHDPQCPLCTQLQREARKALRACSDCDLVYLVANIRAEDGQRFAAQHNVPHVTLVLFNGAGEVQQILNGVRDQEELKPVFESLSQDS